MNVFLFYIIFILFLKTQQSEDKPEDSLNPFKQFVDKTVDPCDNFYKFACGTWLKKNRLEKDEEYKSLFETANQKYLAFVEDAKKGVYDNESPAIRKINKILKFCTSYEKERGYKCSNYILRDLVSYPFASHFLSKEFIVNDRNMHNFTILYNMFNILKEEFKTLIDHKTYMLGEQTKQNYLKKLEHMQFDLSTVYMLSNATMMEECFESLDITNENTELWIGHRLSQFYSRLRNNKKEYFKHCLTFVSDDFYSNTLATPTAKFLPDQNKFVISPMFLRKPFFHKDLPPSILYGSIGFIIAREFIHAFGVAGIFYDFEGKYTHETTSVEAMNNIIEKRHCFQRQYSQEIYNRTDSYVNETKTLEENIADNGAIRLAYRGSLRAYIVNGRVNKKFDGFRNYTDEQYFYMGFGKTFCEALTFNRAEKRLREDVYSPSEIRIKKTLGNFQRFSKAFKCDSGTKMNPRNKCELWRNR